MVPFLTNDDAEGAARRSTENDGGTKHFQMRALNDNIFWDALQVGVWAGFVPPRSRLDLLCLFLQRKGRKRKAGKRKR